MKPKHPQFAAFLTARRNEAGISQPQLAEQVGVSKSNVYYWEQGEYLPQINVLEPLARALKVSYEDLFALAGYVHPEGLPNPEPYLRAKFPGISKRKLAEAARLFDEIEDQEAKRGKKKTRGQR